MNFGSLKDVVNEHALASSVVGLVVASQFQERASLMRHIRRWGWVLAGGFLVYRVRDSDNATTTSLLQDLSAHVSTLVGSSALCRATGDLLGLLLVKLVVDGTSEVSRCQPFGMRGDVMTYIYSNYLSKLPMVAAEVAGEKAKLRADMEVDLKSKVCLSCSVHCPSHCPAPAPAPIPAFLVRISCAPF